MIRLLKANPLALPTSNPASKWRFTGQRFVPDLVSHEKTQSTQAVEGGLPVTERSLRRAADDPAAWLTCFGYGA